MSALSHINYAFSTEGICPVLVERHIAVIREQLATSFFMKREAVNITAKKRLPEDAPFTLTCYTSRSESDPAAMVRAAKWCLPHLELMRKLTQDNFWFVSLWTPGEDAAKDFDAVAIIAEGTHVGAGSLDRLDADQREWLEHMAVRVGGLASPEGFSSQNLARIVFDGLVPLKVALVKELAQ